MPNKPQIPTLEEMNLAYENLIKKYGFAPDTFVCLEKLAHQIIMSRPEYLNGTKIMGCDLVMAFGMPDEDIEYFFCKR